MHISATIHHAPHAHDVSVRTGNATQRLHVPAKSNGQGSAVNGGEFLMLALATCYCNDLFREAARLGIVIDSVQVEASAEFPGVGLAATDIRYSANIESPATAAEIDTLLHATDAVAEVHNTVRAGVSVTLLRGGGTPTYRLPPRAV